MFLAKFALLGLLASPNFNSGVESACSCLSKVSSGASVSRKVKYERKKSKAVFSGQVLEMVERNTRDSYENVVTFRVIETWKRVRTNTIKIITPRASPYSCGYDFQAGETYLVYVERIDDEELWTGICSRTMNLVNAAEDVRILGKGKRF